MASVTRMKDCKEPMAEFWVSQERLVCHDECWVGRTVEVPMSRSRLHDCVIFTSNLIRRKEPMIPFRRSNTERTQPPMFQVRDTYNPRHDVSHVSNPRVDGSTFKVMHLPISQFTSFRWQYITEARAGSITPLILSVLHLAVCRIAGP